jgi:hydroxyacyl-ACP dehydratase HTD2-like protein with hotdog domain
MEEIPIPTPSANSHIRQLSQSATTLFRFSALTFNAHKIHYSLPWAREVEGHRGVAVHGPLNLICMLDFWRDVRKSKMPESELAIPESISYRATSPLYADEKYRLVLEEGEDPQKINIYSPDWTVAMKSDIHGT